MTACQQLMHGTTGGGVLAPLGLVSVNSNGSGVTALSRFNTDGSITCTHTGGAVSAPANWFIPPGGTPGNSYWIRCNVTSGTLTVNQATTFQPLTSNRQFSATAAGLGTAGGTGTFQIATDAGGVNIISTGTWSITCN
jgi:hypothetical protein